MRRARDHTYDLAGQLLTPYVALRIIGSVPDDLTKVILDIVPGHDPTGWCPEAALPDRRLSANEQAWSIIMDTAAAAKLLDD